MFSSKLLKGRCAVRVMRPLLLPQMNIILDEFSSKRRLRLQRYRRDALPPVAVSSPSNSPALFPLSRPVNHQGVAEAARRFRISRGPLQMEHAACAFALATDPDAFAEATATTNRQVL